jgi:hypothetical protein
MIYPITGWSGRYKCLAQMNDGAVFIGCVRPGATGTLPAPLLRLNSYELSTVASIGSTRLQELTSVEVEAVAAPTGAESVDAVCALDHAGWALALETDFIKGHEVGLQVWRYDGGTWTLAAAAIDTAATGQVDGDYRLICVGSEVWVLGRQSYYKAQGAALVSYQVANLPALIADFLATSYETLGGTRQPTCARWRGRWHGYRYGGGQEIIVRNDGGVVTTLATLSSKPPNCPAFVAQESGLHVLSTDANYPYGTDWWSWDGRTLRHETLPATTYFDAAEGNGMAWLLGRGPAEALNARRIFSIGHSGLEVRDVTAEWATGAGPQVDSVALESADGSGSDRPQVDEVSLGFADGSGAARPEVTQITIEFSTWVTPQVDRVSIAHAVETRNRPQVDEVTVESATGSGTERPSVTGVGVEFSDGSGSARPALASVTVEFSIPPRQSPQLDRLALEWAGHDQPGPDEIVVWTVMTDATRLTQAVRVSTNMLANDQDALRVLVRADAEDLPADAWQTYQGGTCGRNIVLEQPGYTVRVGIIGPAAMVLPRVAIQAQRLDP